MALVPRLSSLDHLVASSGRLGRSGRNLDFHFRRGFFTRATVRRSCEAKSSSPPAEVIVEVRQQQRLLAELIGPRDTREADRSRIVGATAAQRVLQHLACLTIGRDGVSLVPNAKNRDADYDGRSGNRNL